MDPQQTERLIEALESIAASLSSMNDDGIDVFCQSLLTVNAMVSAPEGIEISKMPDDHSVQVFNPTSYVTGDIKRFQVETY